MAFTRKQDRDALPAHGAILHFAILEAKQNTMQCEVTRHDEMNARIRPALTIIKLGVSVIFLDLCQVSIKVSLSILFSPFQTRPSATHKATQRGSKSATGIGHWTN
jgi:hypothetical protein